MFERILSARHSTVVRKGRHSSIRHLGFGAQTTHSLANLDYTIRSVLIAEQAGRIWPRSLLSQCSQVLVLSRVMVIGVLP